MMTKLEELHALSLDRGIQIVNEHFSDTKKAACLRCDDYKAVILDKSQIKSSLEEGELLAEEMGHHETESLYLLSCSYNTPLERSNRMVYEARAKF